MNARNPIADLPSAPSYPSSRRIDPDSSPEPDPINEEHACDQLAEYWVRAGNGAIR